MSTELDLGWLDPHLRGLQRRESAGFGTGLSLAVAERLGIDVVLVRVAFAVLSLCAGIGVALYGWGTVLTRGPQGTRPIDQFLPSFRNWQPLSQKLLVVASTIALVATVGAAFPLSWGAGVLVLIALFLLRRRVSGSAPGGGTYPPPRFAGDDPAAPGGAPVDDQTLVENWRRNISGAVGTRHAAVPAPKLPEVDLYAPDEPPTRPAGPQAKAGWWGGLAVVAAMAATAAVTYLGLGLGGTVSLAATTAVGGLGVIVFALVTRRRRIPRPVLALLAVPIVATGWLATQTASSAPLPAAPATSASEAYVVKLFAEDTVVDLRALDLTGYETVRIEAIAANVEVITPPVRSLTVTPNWSADVNRAPLPGAPEAEPLDVDVIIDAQFANVTIKEIQ